MKHEIIFGKTMLPATILLASIVVPIVSAGNDDGNQRELGIEWVNDYSGFPPPPPNFLQYTDEDARGFYNYLGNRGFTRVFDYGNASASERHFEKASVGGQDTNYVDSVDFVYFAGHGYTDGFLFGNNNDGDGTYTFRLHHNEALWGDGDLEWIIISACQILQYPGESDWHMAYNDLHGICSMRTSMYDTPNLGQIFAQYLTGATPYSIKAAWRQATIDDQPGTVQGAYQSSVIRNIYTGITVVEYGNEFLPGYGTGMWPNDPSYYPLPPYVRVWNYEWWSC